MSGSQLSQAADIPDDGTIEQCLRRVVREALKAKIETSVKKARAQVEEELGLEAGFFKDTLPWKARSKHIITAAVDEPESPGKAQKSVPKPPATAKAGFKRKSDEAQPARKRRKKAATPVSGDGAVVDDGEEDVPKPKTNKARRKAKKATSDEEPEESEADAPKPKKLSERSQKAVSDEESAAEDQSALKALRDESGARSDEPEDQKPAANTNGAAADMEQEDEFSDVMDEPVAKKKRPKKSTSPSASKASSAAKKPAKEKKAAKELSPDDEEIKRLQGWLTKCGVRKLWGVELKKYETNKEKIRHLKKMLEDVGMTGRYSQDKATKIKEARELAAELESAKEFNEQWGGGGEESEEGGEKPKRGLKPRGLIDFGDSGDEGT